MAVKWSDGDADSGGKDDGQRHSQDSAVEGDDDHMVPVAGLSPNSPDGIIVDPEFERLLPPHNPAEYAELEASLRVEGCRDAIVVWAETAILLDGYTRREICLRHGIPYKVVPINLPSRDVARLWAISNQLGRRSLTDDQLLAVAGEQYGLLVRISRSDHARHASLARWRGRMDMLGGENDPEHPSNEGKPPKRLAEKVADSTGFTAYGIREAARLAEAAPDLHEQVKAGLKKAKAARAEARRRDGHKDMGRSNTPKQAQEAAAASSSRPLDVVPVARRDAAAEGAAPEDLLGEVRRFCSYLLTEPVLAALAVTFAEGSPEHVQVAALLGSLDYRLPGRGPIGWHEGADAILRDALDRVAAEVEKRRSARDEMAQ